MQRIDFMSFFKTKCPLQCSPEQSHKGESISTQKTRKKRKDKQPTPTMADDFQFGTGNWWDSSRNRFDTSSSPSPSSATRINIGNFGWPTEPTDTKPTPSVDSVSVSASSIVQGTDSTTDGVLTDPNLQMMGLGLSSQGINWNQELIRGEKAEGSFQTMLQDDMSSNTSVHQQQEQWREKIYSSNDSEDSSMNRGFSLDQQPEFTSHMTSPSDGSTVTCPQNMPTNFQMDSTVYGSPSTMLLGLLESENQQNQSIFENRPINYQYPSGFNMNNMGESIPLPPWSKFPQFLRNSPQSQPPHSQLHFSNNAPFWNASAASMNDARASFFPSLQMQLPSSSFDEKPKNLSENRDLSTVGKKSGNDHEQSNKRPRNETAPSPLPAFKVRKEKMGDRITALQQLVSPFGKTDTASVLSEAIEYIKFLHEQVSVLSSPYMKGGAPVQHQQQLISEKSKDLEGPKRDLRSRGLCLVPVSSTFPVTHETTVDFWTPTFGGTFR